MPWGAWSHAAERVVCAKLVGKAVRPLTGNTSVKWHSFDVALVLFSIPAFAHDWYSDLKDARGVGCCSERDCQPVDFCALKDGRQGLAIASIGCVAIDWRKVLLIPSPDGRAHVCLGMTFGRDWRPGWTKWLGHYQRCVILPGEV